MDIGAVLSSPLLGLISFAVPQAAPIISILQRFAPAISAGANLVQAAVKDGIPAFEAAKAQAPDLVKAAQQVFAQVKLHLPGDISLSPDLHLENITRMMVGMHRMTPDEEKVWMDRATPGNDPSQENSKFPIG